MLHSRVARVETPDARRVRIVLKRPWADFMTFYASPATGAAWIVPKAYVEKVGEDGFKRAPVGAGPYRFVSFKRGVELVLEAYEQYWRKVPSVKTLVFRVIPDESTRLAALKGGEVDIAYSFTGPLAEELRKTPGVSLANVYPPFTAWLYPTEQWDPKSPVGPTCACAGRAEPGQVASSRDAGEVIGDTIYGAAMGEPVVNFLQTVGIRARLRPLERAAFTAGFGEHKLRGLIVATSGAAGNGATAPGELRGVGGAATPTAPTRTSTASLPNR